MQIEVEKKTLGRRYIWIERNIVFFSPKIFAAHVQSSGWKEPQPELRQPVLSRSRLASRGQPLARTSRVEWGRGGLYFTVRDWRRGQWRATSPITAAASSLAVMLNTESWLHLDKVHVINVQSKSRQ